MEILGLGNDIIEIERIKKAIERTESFRNKVFTSLEIEYAEKKKNKYETYAGRFACKEAVSKAFGTGVVDFSLLDIEILNDEKGKPIVFLKNQLFEYYKKYKILVSISHCKEYALATAVLSKEK